MNANAKTPIQYVELFHLLFLDQLSRKVDKSGFSLKGGCNLRFFLKSIRYSEDMDLDVDNIARDILRERVNQIITSKPFVQILQTNGIAIAQWSEPKQTDTTQRWKFTLSAKGSNLPLPTKVECSRRGFSGEVRFETVDPELISAYRVTPIMASHYPPNVAYYQKVGALANRTVTQARDIFDLHWLISSGASTNLPDVWLKYRDKALQNVFAVSFLAFKGQVLAYLQPSHRSQYDSEQVWETMQLKVAEALEGGEE